MYGTYSEPCLLSYIQTYSGIFTSNAGIFSYIMVYSEHCITLKYSEPCHIQNSGIYSTRDILRSLSRHIMAYSERCVTLEYSEPCHIQIFGIFRILAYLRPDAYSEFRLFRHIHAYSGMFNNDSYNNINFLFSLLILRTFRRNLKRHMFLTTMVSISMPDWVYLNNKRSFKKAL